jgi:hypothetical protein
MVAEPYKGDIVAEEGASIKDGNVDTPVLRN